MLYNDQSKINLKEQRLVFGSLIVMAEVSGVRASDKLNLRLKKMWH